MLQHLIVEPVSPSQNIKNKKDKMDAKTNKTGIYLRKKQNGIYDIEAV
jgi:hypothetical protein